MTYTVAIGYEQRTNAWDRYGPAAFTAAGAGIGYIAARVTDSDPVIGASTGALTGLALFLKADRALSDITGLFEQEARDA